MLGYPADLLFEDDGVTVTFPDIPEAITCGDNEAEALYHAADALETALDFYFDDGRPVPPPSEPSSEQRMVMLQPDVADRVRQHNAQRVTT